MVDGAALVGGGAVEVDGVVLAGAAVLVGVDVGGAVLVGGGEDGATAVKMDLAYSQDAHWVTDA